MKLKILSVVIIFIVLTFMYDSRWIDRVIRKILRSEKKDIDDYKDDYKKED